jgi:hypothetical protein
VVVLAQPDQFAATPELRTKLGGALGQQAVGGGLRDAQDVGMSRVQPVGRRLGDAGEEATNRVLLAVREEPFQQTALVHHLDAAHVQTERADETGRLRLLVQHEHVRAVQPQLRGQHQPGRPAADNDHVNHEVPLLDEVAFRPAAPRSPAARTPAPPRPMPASAPRFDVPRDPGRQAHTYVANPCFPQG